MREIGEINQYEGTFDLKEGDRLTVVKFRPGKPMIINFFSDRGDNLVYRQGKWQLSYTRTIEGRRIRANRFNTKKKPNYKRKKVL